MKNNGYIYEDFNALFKKYWGKLYAICYRYTQDTEDAKDLVQNIFITLWQKETPLKEELSLEHYLTRAAKYQVFKYLRDRKLFIETSPDEITELPDVSYNPYQRSVYRELSSNLEQQITLLHEPAKTIFRMSRLESLSHKEIAARLGIAIKTVEYHLAKAKKNIRRNFRI